MNVTMPLAAGVAAALVPLCAAPPEADAAIVYTHSDLAAPAPTTLFVTMAVDADLHRPPRVLFAWGAPPLPAGPFGLGIPIADPPDFDAYALIGLDSSGGVLVSFANPAAALGLPFSSVFPGFDESQVAGAIAGGGGPLLDQFVLALGTTPGVRTPMGLECRTTHFSNGADYGSFIAGFSPVPAPGAALILTLAGSCAMTRRRRGAHPHTHAEN